MRIRLHPLQQKPAPRRDAMAGESSPRLARSRRAAVYSIEEEIAHLRDLDIKGLRIRWKVQFKSAPPEHLPRHLMFAVLAYQLQADRLGDLRPDVRKVLDQTAECEGQGVPSAQLAKFDRQRKVLLPGTMLTREWRGKTQRVMVMAHGFGWNGKVYDSLSKAALAITGTRWNGPRFFGLRDAIVGEDPPRKASGR